jgi:ribosomal protein S18 acetylase RimI-like enzyme
VLAKSQKMHLRPTIAADIPRCTSISDAAFRGNELQEFLAPNRDKYPLSWRQLALNSQHQKLYLSNTWSFVCVADANDDFAEEGEILGSARWVRHVSKEDAAADPWTRHLSLLERTEGWLRWAEVKWEETLRINPAVSWTGKDTFLRAIVTSTGFAPLRGTTHWYLQSLAVAPEYQRRGVARTLVNWGVRRADLETDERVAVGKAPVPIALVGTAPGLPLYRSMGFKVIGWADDSYMDVSAEGGSNIIWDKTGYWIQDVDYEPPVKRGVVEAVYKTTDTKSHSEHQPDEDLECLTVK